jgi:hypothetical protein
MIEEETEESQDISTKREDEQLHNVIQVGSDESSECEDACPESNYEHRLQSPADKEISRLAEFVLINFPFEIGLGDLVYGESAVDVAIRLLREHYPFKDKK